MNFPGYASSARLTSQHRLKPQFSETRFSNSPEHNPLNSDTQGTLRRLFNESIDLCTLLSVINEHFRPFLYAAKIFQNIP